MKKTILLIQLAFFFLTFTETYSQPGWFSQNSGTTNWLHGVSFTDVNTGTAVGAGGTILRTTNGGTNWTPQTSGTTYNLTDVSFIGANTGTSVGLVDTILRTINGGTNWTAQTSSTTNYLYGVSFTDAYNGTVVGAYGTILRTTNGGVPFVNQISNKIPEEFSLYQNYPNPFNPITKIRFDLRQSSNTKLMVYNMLGKEIAIPVNEKLSVGSYEVDWNGSDYPSGVYFYKLTTDEFSDVKKMVLLK